MNAGLRLEFSDEKNQTKKQPYEIFGSPIEKKKKTEYFFTLSKSFIIYGK